MYSRRTMAYVFAAPDFNRSAGSVGRSAGAGFSRTLQGQTEYMPTGWGWIDKPLRTWVGIHRALWINPFIVDVAVVLVWTLRKWDPPSPELRGVWNNK